MPTGGESITQVLEDIIIELNHHDRLLMQDAELRMQNPTLQEAWERYQVNKRLSK